MKERLKKLITAYNKTHKGQLLIKDDIVFHADISGFAFPLDYFEDDDVKTVFKRMTKLIDMYMTYSFDNLDTLIKIAILP